MLVQLLPVTKSKTWLLRDGIQQAICELPCWLVGDRDRSVQRLRRACQQAIPARTLSRCSVEMCL